MQMHLQVQHGGSTLSNRESVNQHGSGHVLPKMGKLSEYDIYNQLGQGTFGVVTKARQKKTGKLVALKKFLVPDKKEGFPITAFREITIMKKLKNINVLQIVDMVHDESNGSFFFTVFPYISSDLNGLLNNPRISFSLSQIKCIMIQILKGINYVHLNGYLHRDIKTANILLDHFGIVKIADFGLARLYHGPPPTTSTSPPGGGKYEYTGLVVTRWYRPPELLLGDRKYTTAVDMWGIGCVFGEFFTRKPILEGKSDIHQAELIFKLLGSPTLENFPNAHLINRNGINLKVNFVRSLESTFHEIIPFEALDLLSGMLTLNPQNRYNALKCLDSDFFKLKPLPCHHNELSNLEESHESDVKRFKDELKPFNQKQVTINTQQRNMNHAPNQSLNHSKYGMDGPCYMDRIDSSNNLQSYSDNYPPVGPTRPYRSYARRNEYIDTFIAVDEDRYSRYPNPTKPSYEQTFQPLHISQNSKSAMKTQLPHHQINRIQRHLNNDVYRPQKRPLAFNQYGHSEASTYEEEYHRKRVRPWERERLADSKASSKAGSKDLYGSKSTENAGLSALTKVLLQKKEKKKENGQEHNGNAKSQKTTEK